jgi:hypothetical protein
MERSPLLDRGPSWVIGYGVRIVEIAFARKCPLALDTIACRYAPALLSLRTTTLSASRAAAEVLSYLLAITDVMDLTTMVAILN